MKLKIIWFVMMNVLLKDNEPVLGQTTRLILEATQKVCTNAS